MAAIETESGSGKSHAIGKVAGCFKHGKITKITGSSKKALLHEMGIDVIYDKDTQRYVPLIEKLNEINSVIKQAELKMKKIKDDKSNNDTILTCENYIETLTKLKEHYIKNKRKLIDFEGRVIVFMDTPDMDMLANILSILSHDQYESEYMFAGGSDSKNLDTKKNILRGFPTVIFAQVINTSKHERSTEIRRRFIMLSVSVSENKTKDVIDLKSGQGGSLPEEYEEEIVKVSDLNKVSHIFELLGSKITHYSKFYLDDLKESMHSNELKINPDKTLGVYYPFKDVVANIFKSYETNETIMMTLIGRFNDYLSIIVKAFADERPKIIYENGETLILALPRDIDRVFRLLNLRQKNIRKDVYEYYNNVVLPAYTVSLSR